MKVSICIPCYNQAEFLPEAIESALAQTYKNIEVIVVNDGSPDNTKEVASLYKVKLINQVNKGLASARNAGFMASSGDYFLPLDADDVLMDSCVARIVQVANETNADIVGPSFQTFGESVGQVILMPEPKLEDFRLGNRLGYFSAIKRDAFIEAGGYNPKMVWGYEDLALWVDLLTRGKKVVTIPEILVLYRTKFRSMWKDAVQKHHVELMHQIYSDFPNFLPV